MLRALCSLPADSTAQQWKEVPDAMELTAHPLPLWDGSCLLCSCRLGLVQSTIPVAIAMTCFSMQPHDCCCLAFVESKMLTCHPAVGLNTIPGPKTCVHLAEHQHLRQTGAAQCLLYWT